MGESSDRLDRTLRFEALYNAHYRSISGYVHRRVPEHEAADVIAQVFAVTWRRSSTYRPRRRIVSGSLALRGAVSPTTDVPDSGGSAFTLASCRRYGPSRHRSQPRSLSRSRSCGRCQAPVERP